MCLARRCVLDLGVITVTSVLMLLVMRTKLNHRVWEGLPAKLTKQLYTKYPKEKMFGNINGMMRAFMNSSFS